MATLTSDEALFFTMFTSKVLCVSTVILLISTKSIANGNVISFANIWHKLKQGFHVLQDWQCVTVIMKIAEG